MNACISVGLGLCLLLPAWAVAADGPAEAAVDESRKIKVDERFPLNRIRRALVLIEAASLVVDEHHKQAEAWLREADEWGDGYRAAGKELVPVLFPLLRQAVTHQDLSQQKLDDLAAMFKVAEPAAGDALNYSLTHGAHIAPELTWEIIVRAYDKKRGETALLQAVATISPRDPIAAWRFAARIPLPEDARKRYQFEAPLLLTVLQARNRGLGGIPPNVKKHVAEFCGIYLDEARQRGFNKGEEFNYPLSCRVALGQFIVDPEKGRASLREVKESFPPEPNVEKGAWASRWTATATAAGNQLCLAAIEEAIEDPGAEKSLAAGLRVAAQLRELLDQRPKETDPKLANAVYRKTVGELADVLVLVSPAITERFLKEMKSLSPEKDAAVGERAYVDLVTYAFRDPAKAGQLLQNLKSPELRAQAYLGLARIARRQNIRKQAK